MYLSINEICYIIVLVLSFCFGYLKADIKNEYKKFKYKIIKTPTPYDDDNVNTYYKQ